jgi:hypothetical protein
MTAGHGGQIERDRPAAISVVECSPAQVTVYAAAEHLIAKNACVLRGDGSGWYAHAPANSVGVVYTVGT